MPQIILDDEETWPKIGQIVSFCTDSQYSTGWILAIFLGRKSPKDWLTKCMLFIDKSPDIRNVHYTRLDTDLLEYDYKRLPDKREP